MPQLHFRPDGAYLTTLAASSVRVIPSRKRVKAFGEIFSHRENYVSSWSNGSSFNSVQATPPTRYTSCFADPQFEVRQVR